MILHRHDICVGGNIISVVVRYEGDHTGRCEILYDISGKTDSTPIARTPRTVYSYIETLLISGVLRGKRVFVSVPVNDRRNSLATRLCRKLEYKRILHGVSIAQLGTKIEISFTA